MVRLASFPELNPNPIVEADLTGHVHYLNPAAEAMFPDLRTAGPSHPWLADLKAAAEMLEKAKKRSYIRQVKMGDIWYEQNIYYIPEDRRIRIYGRDITGSKQSEQALEKARAEAEEERGRLEAMMQALPVGVAITDLQGGNIRANDAFEKIWSGPRPPARSVNDYGAYKAWWTDTGQPIRPEEWASAQAVQKGQPVVGQLLEIQRFDGSRASVINSGAPIFDAKGNIVGSAVAIQDITVLRNAELALRKSKEKYEILSETAAHLLAIDNPQEIVNDLCQKVMSHIGCHAFFNYLHDEDAGRLHLNAYAGIPEQTGKQIEWLDYGVAVCGCAARDACRIVAEDIQNRPDPRTELVKSFGIKAYACHPLFSAGRVIGTLSFGTRTRTTFSEEELLMMKTVADQVAIAMERMRLVEALRRSRDELEIRVRERTEELASVVSALKVEMNERRQAQMAIMESERQLRTLSSQRMAAQENERKRVARELHDGLGQTLTAIKFKVEAFLQEIKKSKMKTKAKSLEGVILMIQEGVREIRRIQMDLRPSILDDLGILATISWLCREFETTFSGIHVDVQTDIREEDVDESLKMVIYRILQEALNNISKHSHADRVCLILRKGNGEIELSVQDNGQGFDLQEAASQEGSKRGIGLASMKERVESSKGVFSIESAKGAGTRIQVSWMI